MLVLGLSGSFLECSRLVRKYAEYDAPVLIEGETGTGKELAAREIHYSSARRNMPFVPVNCGAIPDSLVESELFGHLKGAFTDAREDNTGLIAHAEGGTLFLDEVETLTPKAQVTLLRFLQDGQYRPLGGKTYRTSDVRLIAASNAKLEGLVQAGAFRLDLMFRLRILCLVVPPLRERREDIPLLAQHFVDETCTRFRQPGKRIHPDSYAWMYRYPWPGNVRELENLVCSAVILSEETEIRILPPPNSGFETGEKAFRKATGEGTHSFHSAKAQVIHDFENEYLKELMHKAQGNVSRAAQLSGKERRALGKLLKKHGIEKEEFLETKAG